MKKYTLLKIFLILALNCLCTFNDLDAQSLTQKIADKEFANMHYATAIEYYEDVIAVDSNNTEALKKLADCYFKVKNTTKAEKVYRKLINGRIGGTTFYFYLAELLSENGKYTEARKWYKKYLDETPDDAAENSLKSLSHVSKLYTDSSSYKIYLPNFNSLQADFSPTPYDSGIVFSSSRTEGVVIKRVYGWDNSAYLDLYFTDTLNCEKQRYFTSTEEQMGNDTIIYSGFKEGIVMQPDETERTSNDTRTQGFYGMYFKKDNIWNNSGKASKLSNVINTKYHEGPASFFGDSVIYFTRNKYNGWAADPNEDRKTNLSIYTSTKKNGVWAKPKILPFCKDNFSVGHPAISADGKTLYFASDKKEGKGKTDLYKVTYSDGKWSKPEILGDAINTSGDDFFPYVDAHNNLFFASSGHGGLGGLDIFKINLNNENEGVKNMGYPVNSKKDDFGFIAGNDGKSGFFSSNRKRGGPDDDIFMFTYVPRIRLQGKILFIEDESPIDSAEVRLILDRSQIGSTVTLKNGVYAFDVDPDKVYTIEVTRRGFANQKVEVYTQSVKLAESMEFNIYLDKNLHIALEGLFTDKLTKDNQFYEPVVLVNKTLGDTVKAKTDQNGAFYFSLKPGNDYEVYGTKGTIRSNVEKLTTKGIKTSTTIRAFLYIPEPNDCDKLRQKYFLENTYYDLAKDEVRKDAKVTLDRIVKMLQDEPGLILGISSFTDSRGSNAFNDRLSMRRTNAVSKYLINNGIDSLRLRKYYGGETSLINNCGDGTQCLEKEHQRNRRTQYIIWRNGVNLATLKCHDGMAVQGIAFSSMTKDPMDSVKISLIDKKDGSVITSFITLQDGVYKFDIKDNQTYIVRAEAEGCAVNSIDLSTSDKKREVVIDFPMLCEGDVIKVDNIYFDLGKYNIRKDASKELDKVVFTMKKYKKMKIELRSHTDSRGTAEANLTLSDNRAKSSAAYIVSKGIAKDRIQGHGYGETLPLNECTDGVKCSETDYQKNRRTEFKILSVK